MIQISSNAVEVQNRLGQFLTRIPASMRATTMAPKSWIPLARKAATEACMALSATPDERKLIPQVVSTVMVEYLGASGGSGSGMLWTAGNVARALSVTEAIAGAGGLGPLFQTDLLQDLREIVSEWVRTPESEGGKRRDERDFGDADEIIVARIMRVLMMAKAGEFEAAGAAGVTRHIEAFARMRGALPGMDKGLLDRWVRGILGAWTNLLMEQLGPMARDAIRSAWNGTKTK